MTQIIANDHCILLVDDDPSVNASIAMLLKRQGFSVLLSSSPSEALSMLTSHTVSLVIQDMNFSRNTTGEEGMQLLSKIKSSYPALPIILMTAWGSIKLAVDGIKLGAADFVTKPWDNQQLVRCVSTCLALHQNTLGANETRQKLDESFDFSDIVAEDPTMVEVLNVVARVAATDASVLILGESGTGKELIANAIHKNSQRSGGPLVKVNLGGMTSTLFESEMFGHAKGAFTDAKLDRQGRFDLAKDGSIFLDEIGDLDASSQVKLLRVLQDQSFQAVGSSVTKQANVRVISATNRDLYEMVEQGSFREDLLYRINLIVINVPPLRARRSDISRIAKLHLSKVAKRYNIEHISFDKHAFNWLEQQPWPGNVRQLTQAVERAALMSDGPILSVSAFTANQAAPDSNNEGASIAMDSLTLDEMEKLMVLNAIKAHDNNLSKVAEALGISRAALYRRIEKHGITT